MKKMLAILLIAGILIMGTFSVIAGISEENSCEDLNFTDENSGDGFGNTTTDEGAGGGGGGIPG